MFGLDDLLTGGLSLAGGFMNNMFAGQRQNDAQAFNASQAAANRAFQMEMDNTKYQRSADDMQKAGLNRILALGGPGSPPSGNMAQSSPGAPVHDIVGPAVNTAMASAKLKQELENMKYMQDNIAKDTRLKVSQGNTEDVRTMQTLSDTKLKDEHTKHTAQQIQKGLADAVKSQVDADQYGTPAMKVLRQTGNVGHEIQRGSSAVGNVPAIINTFKDRWPKEETTYYDHGPGKTGMSTKTRR